MVKVTEKFSPCIISKGLISVNINLHILEEVHPSSIAGYFKFLHISFTKFSHRKRDIVYIFVPLFFAGNVPKLEVSPPLFLSECE